VVTGVIYQRSPRITPPCARLPWSESASRNARDPLKRGGAYWLACTGTRAKAYLGPPSSPPLGEMLGCTFATPLGSIFRFMPKFRLRENFPFLASLLWAPFLLRRSKRASSPSQLGLVRLPSFPVIFSPMVPPSLSPWLMMNGTPPFTRNSI